MLYLTEQHYPEEIGDLYLLEDYLFPGNHMWALAYPGTARVQELNEEGNLRAMNNTEGWGWWLQGDDGDMWYIGHPGEDPPISWLHLIPCDGIHLAQRRRPLMPTNIEDIAHFLGIANKTAEDIADELE